MKNDDLREFLKNNLRIRINEEKVQYGNGDVKIEIELYLQNEFTNEEVRIDRDSITLKLLD
jgi:hypothetical protein